MQINNELKSKLVKRAVQNKRYSRCTTAPLEDLDFSNWWTDDSFDEMYLHVPHKDGDTVHRVKCRGCKKPRLEWNNKRGLMWLYTVLVKPKKAKK